MSGDQHNQAGLRHTQRMDSRSHLDRYIRHVDSEDVALGDNHNQADQTRWRSRPGETMGQAFERAKRERDAAEAKVRAVRNLHFTMTGVRCEECASDQWPCDTVRALDAAGVSS